MTFDEGMQLVIAPPVERSSGIAREISRRNRG
jgi:hypothetical protein